MEALWSLEDKLKLSTQETLLLFVCAAFAVVGLCATTMLKRKKIGGKELIDEGPGAVKAGGWGTIKRALMCSVRWSGACRWEDMDAGNWKQRRPPLLVKGSYEANGRWQSHNSVSPVWQRPILMGEKCELPKFSGLILYDEQGRLLHHSNSNGGSTTLQVIWTL
ncbi:PREDICTED: uncharacterized protein LOC104609028 [Nelumbo nucifera]|uniref:Uncharacterized protein n=2 Tax=Nelumbo nucifera TaxID=4432 RepID=A0A822YU84_NELNU|nr:PREDICTED: uncharacterized protein LOC104609028 [Nelumbo nucifera]DAD37664.1 TPA_asm: hypothetical protein HUJ06_008305 [Nelumbo nucifera]